MADDIKIKPWEDYNYTAKLPDFWEVCGIITGVYMCKVYHVMKQRPLNTPIAMATMGSYVLGGYVIGKGLCKLRDNYLRRRQVFLEHYMDTHPEDFISPEPKKFKDVLWRWDPVR